MASPRKRKMAVKLALKAEKREKLKEWAKSVPEPNVSLLAQEEVHPPKEEIVVKPKEEIENIEVTMKVTKEPEQKEEPKQPEKKKTTARRKTTRTKKTSTSTTRKKRKTASKSKSKGE